MNILLKNILSLYYKKYGNLDLNIKLRKGKLIGQINNKNLKNKELIEFLFITILPLINNEELTYEDRLILEGYCEIIKKEIK